MQIKKQARAIKNYKKLYTHLFWLHPSSPFWKFCWHFLQKKKYKSVVWNDTCISYCTTFIQTRELFPGLFFMLPRKFLTRNIIDISMISIAFKFTLCTTVNQLNLGPKLNVRKWLTFVYSTCVYQVCASDEHTLYNSFLSFDTFHENM